MRQHLTKKNLILAGVATAALLAFTLYKGRGTKESLTYRFASLERGNIVASVNATGAITPLSTVIVGSQMSGQIVEVLADYNSAVEAGQVLARLDQTQVLARLDGLRADLAQSNAQKQVQLATIEKVKAEAARIKAVLQDMEAQVARTKGILSESEHQFERQNALNKGGFSSNAAFETTKTALNTAKSAFESANAQKASAQAQVLSNSADLKVAEAQVLVLDATIMQKSAAVRQVEVDLANTEIKSSVKGVVVNRQVELGMAVAASLQSPTLFLVAQDLREMEILANVDEADVGRIVKGQRVSFTVNAYPTQNFEGTVKLVRLGSQTVQNVVIYTAVISLRNDDNRLRPGMTATLRVLTDERNNVLRINNAALRYRPVAAKTEAASAPPALTLAPTAPPPPQRGQGGGRVMQELVATLKTELKLTDKQGADLDKLVVSKRGDFTGLANPSLSQPERQELMRTIRNTLYDEIALLLDDKQKDGLLEIKARLDERRGQNAGGTTQRLFILNSNGEAEGKSLRLGLTDGTYTEVLTPSAKEGDKFITGASAAK